MIGTCGADGSLASNRAALRPFARVLQGLEVARVAQRHRAHPDAEPRLVHHVEHVGQAAVLLADQIADRAWLSTGRNFPSPRLSTRVGDAPLAHLVVQPGQHHVVAFTDRAVGVDEELRHDEQRDALGARRSAGDLGEHQVDDVLGELVFGRRRSTSWIRTADRCRRPAARHGWGCRPATSPPGSPTAPSCRRTGRSASA